MDLDGMAESPEFEGDCAHIPSFYPCCAHLEPSGESTDPAHGRALAEGQRQMYVSHKSLVREEMTTSHAFGTPRAESTAS